MSYCSMGGIGAETFTRESDVDTSPVITPKETVLLRVKIIETILVSEMHEAHHATRKSESEARYIDGNT